MDPQELIFVLKEQHRRLQKNLSLALKDSETDIKGEDVLLNFIEFKQNFSKHLKFENEKFYPDYLNKKIKRGEDITHTKEFIRKMADIANIVIGFLNKYNTSEIISANRSLFREELLEVINTLNLRIETEEDGVFDIYIAM